ncbi:MAG: phage portal protein [Bacteroidales bacterium]|jgi:HK97 family phage portal protein|nr:phage portal protein [Bacteroidales bacterium]
MGLFDSLFSKKKETITSSKIVNMFTPYFNQSASAELNETFISAVETHTMHFSKVKPRVYFKDKEVKPYLNKLLTVKPNQVMEAGTFWEKVNYNYWVECNVFIYIDWDFTNTSKPIKSLWVLNPMAIETSMEKGSGDLILKFTLNEEIIFTKLDNIIHIARNVDDYGLFGEKSNAINTVLNVINTNYEGIENAIKTSAFLRFVLTTTSAMTDKKREEKANLFAETYLGKDSKGVAFVDAATTVKQIDSQSKYANADEMKFFEKKIYNYLHTNEKIIQGNFTEDDWQAYYETAIEPIINKLTNELNYKLLTTREYDMGNRIIVSAGELQVTSTKTKISLISETKEIGLFSINEARKIFNMPPIEDGNKHLVSLNYINSELASEYQLNASKNKNKEAQKNEDEV